MAREAVILLVDDEASDREGIGTVLKENGYRILEADSYRSAMEIFNANRLLVDLLVADISLPDGNGCAMALEMRRQRPDLRILFISFHVGAEICRYYGIETPEYQFLKKPFDERALTSRVRRILGEAEPLKWNTANASPSLGEE